MQLVEHFQRRHVAATIHLRILYCRFIKFAVRGNSSLYNIVCVYCYQGRSAVNKSCCTLVNNW